MSKLICRHAEIASLTREPEASKVPCASSPCVYSFVLTSITARTTIFEPGTRQNPALDLMQSAGVNIDTKSRFQLCALACILSWIRALTCILGWIHGAEYCLSEVTGFLACCFNHLCSATLM